MSNPMHYVAFFLVSLFWGCSFFAIGVAVQHYPPVFAAFLRVLIAHFFITSYLLLKNGKIEKSPYWKQLVGTGLFLMGIPWIFLFWGEKHITPALASILNATVPIFTIILSPLITPNVKQGKNQWLGVLLGFLGILVIFLPQINHHVAREIKGMLALVIMAFCYAIGILWLKRLSHHVRNSVSLYYQSLAGLIFLLLYFLFMEAPHSTITWSLPGFLAIFYLGFFSTFISWLLFFKLQKEIGTLQAAANSYCIPLFALTIDYFFWQKWVTPEQIAGVVIIFLGIFLINKRTRQI